MTIAKVKAFVHATVTDLEAQTKAMKLAPQKYLFRFAENTLYA